MNPGKNGSGLRIVISQVDNSGRITGASVATGNAGSNYKNGDMTNVTAFSTNGNGTLNATGTAANYAANPNPTFGTIANPLTATNGTQWIVFVDSNTGAAAYNILSGYIIPAGVGDFMNPGVNRAGNDTEYSVTIRGSSLGGTDASNDLTFYPEFQPSIIRVDPVSSGTPAYFLVTKTLNGAVSGIQLIHGGSGFTQDSAITWATTNINGHLAAHKTATAGINTVLGMVVGTDPSAIRRVWFIKDAFKSSSVAVLGTPYYPKPLNGYGMYVNYTTDASGIVTNISLVNAGTGYLTNDLVHTGAGIPQPIQHGVSTGKMNFSLDMPEGRGVTGSINITGGVPGISGLPALR